MFTLLLLIGLNAHASSLSLSAPPMPYFDWGACPFECCTYRTWSVLRKTSVLSSRKAGAPVAFQLNPGERVEGITGVVITTRPGRIKVVAPITLGAPSNSVALQPGDIIFTLRYSGEGYEVFWFKGRTYKDQVSSQKLGEVPGMPALQVLELETNVWWVKIRNQSGKVGWSRQPEDFGDIDACG